MVLPVFRHSTLVLIESYVISSSPELKHDPLATSFRVSVNELKLSFAIFKIA